MLYNIKQAMDKMFKPTQSFKHNNSKTEVKSIEVEQYSSLEFEKIS